jgi:hypothetical protein
MTKKVGMCQRPIFRRAACGKHSAGSLQMGQLEAGQVDSGERAARLLMGMVGLGPEIGGAGAVVTATDAVVDPERAGFYRIVDVP